MAKTKINKSTKVVVNNFNSDINKKCRKFIEDTFNKSPNSKYSLRIKVGQDKHQLAGAFLDSLSDYLCRKNFDFKIEIEGKLALVFIKTNEAMELKKVINTFLKKRFSLLVKTNRVEIKTKGEYLWGATSELISDVMDLPNPCQHVDKTWLKTCPINPW